ncbi:MAG: prolyl oligopeptidase family serine peptidase [Solirubrobacteraceae bacterium]
MPARRAGQVDDYHGELVADPYRWLEDTNASETKAWIEAGNELTEEWLSQVKARAEIGQRLSELWDYPRFKAPFERGGRRFQLRNSGLQNQDVLYVMESAEDEGRVLLDPNELSPDGTVAVPSFDVTEDGALLVYATSGAGSDWKTWHVREVPTGRDRADVVEWSKYSRASWLKDGSGFYYVAVDPPTPGAEYLEAARPQKLAFHRLGTQQSEDEIVFEAPEEPEWTLEAIVSDDGRFTVISISEGTAPEAQLRVLDREDPARGLRPLVTDFSSKASYVANVGTTFYLLTDDMAERQRIVAVDLENPGREEWRQVIPESTALLLAARHCSGRLVCHHLKDACSRLAVFDFDGSHVRDVPVPEVSSLLADYDEAGFEGRPDSTKLHFAVTSFTNSGSLWEHDLESGETRLVTPPAARVDPQALVSEQVFVTADDGASIPLFLTRRRDVNPNGDVHVLLYGYGGFDISMTPQFSVSWAAFVERGGVFAVAVLRGGGEYGRSWHRAGMLSNKQRVFDDFCDCARWLAASGWSRPRRIAINGLSNGGLLVGACITQHPELFGAAVADVGVFDMLRFHRFTIGWAWKSDYGDPDDPEQYRWVRAYSPLHNVHPGRRYPPILLTTGDHDDRVIPGHSFKFAATLQAAADTDDASSGPPAPVLVRTETSAGHGHGLPTTKAIAKATDVLAFIEGTVGDAAAPWPEPRRSIAS